jgi:hypothetical protein
MRLGAAAFASVLKRCSDPPLFANAKVGAAINKPASASETAKRPTVTSANEGQHRKILKDTKDSSRNRNGLTDG